MANKKLSKQDIQYQLSKPYSYRELEHSYKSMSDAYDKLAAKTNKLMSDLNIIIEDHRGDADFPDKIENIINGN